MRRVTVEVPGHHYPVLIGDGALRDVPELLRTLGAKAAAVVTDRVVADQWASSLIEHLGASGLRTGLYVCEGGEQVKTLAEVERVLCFLEESEIDRDGALIALGGGTIGDMAGFAAAIWLRGIRCVQVPTTLLAMVDSSVGGKTGVNTARTKNGVGAYWQPAAVVADLSLLATLPEAEYLAAFGEVVRAAVTMDRSLAGRLATDGEVLRARSSDALEPVVARSVELKAGVVARDERESGLRAILNYGHTVGHAVEVASGYRAAHGRAVALGMEAAARIGLRLGLCEPAFLSSQRALLDAFGLPGPLPAVSASAVLDAIPHDKKRRDGRVRWVLPREIGRAQVGMEVPDQVVAEVVRDLVGQSERPT